MSLSRSVCITMLFVVLVDRTIQAAASPAPSQLAQEAYLKASNTGANDLFGRSVAVSGDTIAIGAYQESSDGTGVNGNQTNNYAPNSGAVYVFVRNGTNWIQQAYIKASNTGASDQFGLSVALETDTLVVGALREDSNAKGVNGDQNDNSATDSGAAYIFVRNGTNWSQQAYLKASNTERYDSFGRAVAISDNTVVVGASMENSSADGVNGDQADNTAPGAGAAYVFVRNGTNWSQQAYLKASNSEGRLPSYGDEGDLFGGSVAICGDTVVVGAGGEDSIATGVNGDPNNNRATNSGAAYVFVRVGTNWSQQAYLKASNTEAVTPGELWYANDRFGGSVAISSNTVVIGAAYEDSSAVGVNGDQNDNGAADSGAAYVFVRSGTNWTQEAYLKPSKGFYGFGFSVSMCGDTICVGMPYDNSNKTGVNDNLHTGTVLNSGAAYVFVRSGTNWSERFYLKASNPGEFDDFGLSASISGDTIVLGAYKEDSNATGINGSQFNDLAMDAGAAYVFAPTRPGIRIGESSGQIRVMWPMAASNFVLETSSALDPRNWTQLPPPYQANTSNYFIAVPPSSTNTFYRLRGP